MPDKEIGRFDAVDDDGMRYTIIEFEHLDIHRDINGNLMNLGGQRRLRLLTGEDVNRAENGAFKIFETGKLLRKVE